MGVFGLFKGKQTQKQSLQVVKPSNARIIAMKANNDLVIRRHDSRIKNLSEELERLTKEINRVENDLDMSKGEKAKVSDRLVRRMTLINHEISIREELLNGFINSRIK